MAPMITFYRQADVRSSAEVLEKGRQSLPSNPPVIMQNFRVSLESGSPQLFVPFNPLDGGDRRPTVYNNHITKVDKVHLPLGAIGQPCFPRGPRAFSSIP